MSKEQGQEPNGERESESVEGGVELSSAEAEEEQPKITLDRYLSRRRPPLRSTWSQVASLVLMLIALIMIFAYKNRCGLAVADFFGGGAEQSDPGPR